MLIRISKLQRFTGLHASAWKAEFETRGVRIQSMPECGPLRKFVDAADAIRLAEEWRSFLLPGAVDQIIQFASAGEALEARGNNELPAESKLQRKISIIASLLPLNCRADFEKDKLVVAQLDRQYLELARALVGLSQGSEREAILKTMGEIERARAAMERCLAPVDFYPTKPPPEAIPKRETVPKLAAALGMKTRTFNTWLVVRNISRHGLPGRGRIQTVDIDDVRQFAADLPRVTDTEGLILATGSRFEDAKNTIRFSDRKATISGEEFNSEPEPITAFKKSLPTPLALSIAHENRMIAAIDAKKEFVDVSPELKMEPWSAEKHRTYTLIFQKGGI